MSASGDEDALALRTARLALHYPTGSARDAALMLAVMNDPAFIAHVRDSGVRDLDAAHRALQLGPMAYRASNGLGLCRVVEPASDRDIGQIGLVTREGLPAPDLGYAFLPGARGQGYATEAGRAVLDHARQVLRLPRVLALVSPGNTASLAVLDRLGFTFETMTQLPGVDHVLRQFSITLHEER